MSAIEKPFFKMMSSGTSATELHEAKKTFGELILLHDLLLRKVPKEAKCSLCKCQRQVRVIADGSSAYYSIPVEITELLLEAMGFKKTAEKSERCLRCETICKTSSWEKEEP